MTETAPAPKPLFYVDPVPLSASVHGAWRLANGDMRFAAAEPAIPLMAGEFAAAARSYPILFAGDEGAPIALVGLARTNLFVTDGRWEEGAYIPAYVRRYPFALIGPDGGDPVLAIDAASDRVRTDGDEGQALYADGQPAPVTMQALNFCGAMLADHEGTRGFSAALVEKGLLVDRRADATLPDGRRLGVAGFKVIDPDAFAGLDAETVFAWHGRGWLALAHFHMASLDRFAALLDRQGADGGKIPAADMPTVTETPSLSARGRAAKPALPKSKKA